MLKAPFAYMIHFLFGYCSVSLLRRLNFKAELQWAVGLDEPMVWLCPYLHQHKCNTNQLNHSEKKSLQMKSYISLLCITEWNNIPQSILHYLHYI